MKSVLLHAALALFGLGFAYQTWTRPAVLEEKPSDEITLLACDPAQITQIELVQPTHRVTVRPEQGKSGREYWITSTPTPIETKKPAAAGADGGVEESDAGAPAAPPPTKKSERVFDGKAPVTFVANAAFEAYLKAYFPVRALRGLGVIDKSEYADFGLDKVGTHLKVTCGGQTLALEIAGRTHGSNENYVRDPKSDRSYLLPGRLVRDLQSAQFNFTQSELHAFKLTDVDETVITAMGETRRLLQRDRKIPGQAQWVDAAQPDRRNELFGNWLDRLGKLKVRQYLARDAQPGADLQVPAKPPVTVMTIEHHAEGKPKGKLEVVRVDTDKTSYFYAKSEATRIWVSLYEATVKELVQDLGLVMDGEDVSERSAPESAAPQSP